MTTWVPELLLQIRIKAVAKIVHPGGADEEWEEYRKTLFDSDTMRDRIRAWHANPAPGLKWDSVEGVHKENWMMALGVPDVSREAQLQATSISNRSLVIANHQSRYEKTIRRCSFKLRSNGVYTARSRCRQNGRNGIRQPDALETFVRRSMGKHKVGPIKLKSEQEQEGVCTCIVYQA
jgi:hypothetical protein